MTLARGLSRGLARGLARGLGASVAASTPLLLATLVTGTIAYAQNQSIAGTYTRAAPSSYDDWEGVIRYAISGQSCHPGCRVVKNVLTKTEDFSDAAWTLIFGGTGSVPTKTPNYAAAPDGTTTACRLVCTRGGGVGGGDYSLLRQAITSVAGYTKSIFMKSNTGSSQQVCISVGGAGTVVTVTTAWQRFGMNEATASAVYDIGSGISALGQASIDVLIWHPQCEDASGQSVVAPGEYVSVGVLSAPFHGQNVDGVKGFSTENGNTVTNNVVTEAQGPMIGTVKWGVCPNQTTSYFSAPDFAAARIVGDLDIDARIALASYTPTLAQEIFSKDAVGQFAYLLRVDTSGFPTLYWSQDGSTLKSAVSTTALSNAANTQAYIRAYLDADNGASGYSVYFYTSPDGSNWTQLGSTVTAAGVTSIFAGTSVLAAGRSFTSSNQVNGKIYRVRVYNGNRSTGTLAVDFNPSLWTSGATWTSATGETWTINGNATVFAPVMRGYQEWEARTNLLTYSADQSQAIYAVAAGAKSANSVVGPDGRTTGTTFTEDTANAAHYIYYNGVTVSAGATAAFPVFLKAGTRRYVILSINNAGNESAICVDTTTWTITANYTVGVGTSSAGSYVDPVQYANGFRRIVVVGALTGLTTYYCVVAASNSATPTAIPTFVGTSSTIITFGWQLEAAATASPYIPTVASTVARASDILGFPSAGNISGTVGTISVTYTAHVLGIGQSSIVNPCAATGRSPLYRNSSNQVGQYDGTNVSAYTADLNNRNENRIAVTWGTSQKAYLNGVLVGSTTFDGDYTIGSDIYVGSYSGGTNCANACIKNLRIFRPELVGAEVVKIAA